MVHPSPAGTVLGTLPQPEDVARLNLPVIQEPSEGPETARAANVLAKADERIAVPEGMLLSQPATKEGERSNSSEIGSFVLGEGLPPVPAKLVAKILKGEFIDMAELLRDNIEAERRRGGSDTASIQLRPSRREIPDILSWLQCFEYLQVWWLANTQTRCPSYWPTRRPLLGKLGAVGGPGGKLMTPCFASMLPPIPSRTGPN